MLWNDHFLIHFLFYRFLYLNIDKPFFFLLVLCRFFNLWIFVLEHAPHVGNISISYFKIVVFSYDIVSVLYLYHENNKSFQHFLSSVPAVLIGHAGIQLSRYLCFLLTVRRRKKLTWTEKAKFFAAHFCFQYVILTAVSDPYFSFIRRPLLFARTAVFFLSHTPVRCFR